MARWPLLPPAERFAAKLEPQADGCLNFAGSLAGGTYPTFKADGRTWKAHRWAWEQANGPVPDGCDIHHRCRNRRCVNLDHLELVTRAEHQAIHESVRNLVPGQHGVGCNRAKTHCPKGHPYDADNTYVTKDGRRQCRACHRARQRKAA